MRRRLLAPAAAVALAALGIAGPARAETRAAQTSSNWAGYTVTGARFSKASGTWTQPQADCDSGDGDAAFWVGLGGATETSQALEQVGTEATCENGRATYAAWYELVPDDPAAIRIAVRPGDTISAYVRVKGTTVTIWLKNRTTGRSITKTLTMSRPDTTSAEWIAEAPSQCLGGASGSCRTVPLTDFGTVTFKNATATAKGLTGPIVDRHWTTTPMELQPGAAPGYGGGRFGDEAYRDATSTASAIPSALTPSGKGFAVTWQGDAAAT